MISDNFTRFFSYLLLIKIRSITKIASQVSAKIAKCFNKSFTAAVFLLNINFIRLQLKSLAVCLNSRKVLFNCVADTV